MQRTVQAADIAGIRAFAVHAKDEEARRFYQKFDFIPSPTDPMHLFVLLKDVRRIISGWEKAIPTTPAGGFPAASLIVPLKLTNRGTTVPF